MPRNIEVKAKVNDVEDLKQRVQALSDGAPVILHQRDVFFKVSSGRLKLRYQTGKDPQLISYNRQDLEGPKVSDYEILTQTEQQAKQLEPMLGQCIGTLGEVKKFRSLFFVGQTRLHIDQVETLGCFLELEVVVQPGQTVADAEAIAKDLMSKLDVSQDDLVACAYIDKIVPRVES